MPTPSISSPFSPYLTANPCPIRDCERARAQSTPRTPVHDTPQAASVGGRGGMPPPFSLGKGLWTPSGIFWGWPQACTFAAGVNHIELRTESVY